MTALVMVWLSDGACTCWKQALVGLLAMVHSWRGSRKLGGACVQHSYQIALSQRELLVVPRLTTEHVIAKAR